jgi:hypothetical protein
MCSTVFKLVWGLALSCCKRKVIFFSGLNLEIRAFRVDGLSGLKEIQKDHPFPIPKDSAHYFTR